MTLPNFIIIGAEKSGTTSLYNYIDQHPKIYMSPEKEPYYFICQGGHSEVLGNRVHLDKFLSTRIESFDEYKKLFSGVTDEKAIGEASAAYIYVSEAARKIKELIPDVKLIVVLRNPVDRAYSNFKHCVGRGVEPLCSFEDAIAQEKKRVSENWGLVHYYQEKGFYYKYLKEYYKIFSKEQIKVYLYDDYLKDSLSLCQDIFSFLEVDANFCPEFDVQHNVSTKTALKDNAFTKVLRSRNPIKLLVKDLVPQAVKDKVVESLNQYNSDPIPLMTEEMRKQLKESYREDILKLQDLIGKDLTNWLS